MTAFTAKAIARLAERAKTALDCGWDDNIDPPPPEECLALIAALRAAEERADRAEARVKVLTEALEPFAAEASMWASTISDGYRPKCCEPGNTYAHPGSEAKYNVGHLRKAARALDVTGGEL